MAEVIKANGKDYSLDELSEEAIMLMLKIFACEAELQRYEAQIDIMRFARATYSGALEQLITSASISATKNN